MYTCRGLARLACGPDAAFLSHHKADANSVARDLKIYLEGMLGQHIFLDSDDLSDLKELLDHVRHSKVLVLLQTEKILQRPWCLLELKTAIEHRHAAVELPPRAPHQPRR